jgi:hypothetical protein
VKIKHFILSTIISTLVFSDLTLAGGTIDSLNNDQNAVKTIRPIRIFSKGRKPDRSLWIGVSDESLEAIELPKNIKAIPERRASKNPKPIVYSLKEEGNKSIKERLKELFNL